MLTVVYYFVLSVSIFFSLHSKRFLLKNEFEMMKICVLRERPVYITFAFLRMILSSTE